MTLPTLKLETLSRDSETVLETVECELADFIRQNAEDADCMLAVARLLEGHDPAYLGGGAFAFTRVTLVTP